MMMSYLQNTSATRHLLERMLVFSLHVCHIAITISVSIVNIPMLYSDVCMYKAKRVAIEPTPLKCSHLDETAQSPTGGRHPLADACAIAPFSSFSLE
jgi:hypothetical protein